MYHSFPPCICLYCIIFIPLHSDACDIKLLYVSIVTAFFFLLLTTRLFPLYTCPFLQVACLLVLQVARHAVVLAHAHDDGAPFHALEAEVLGLELRDGVRRQLHLKRPPAAAAAAARHGRPPEQQLADGVRLGAQQRRAAKLVPDHLLRVLREAVRKLLERRVHGALKGLLVGRRGRLGRVRVLDPRVGRQRHVGRLGLQRLVVGVGEVQRRVRRGLLRRGGPCLDGRRPHGVCFGGVYGEGLVGVAAAAAAGWEENGFAPNGLLPAAPPGEELNGFAFDENGFAPAEADGPPPKRASPSLGLGGSGSLGFSAFFASSSFFFLFSAASAAAEPSSSHTRTPRTARMLPSRRLQLARLQAKTYIRRSWLGNRSGSSPLSCSRSTIRSLQILHRASAAEGGLSASTSWRTYRTTTDAAYCIFVGIFRCIAQENIRLGEFAI
ncbi:hypothetical protein IF2G_02219 [Cordyceps javanica]|nr:hypothetical protein IF2G_02219 [Cordyceps javanica]